MRRRVFVSVVHFAPWPMARALDRWLHRARNPPHHDDLHPRRPSPGAKQRPPAAQAWPQNRPIVPKPPPGLVLQAHPGRPLGRLASGIAGPIFAGRFSHPGGLAPPSFRKGNRVPAWYGAAACRCSCETWARARASCEHSADAPAFTPCLRRGTAHLDHCSAPAPKLTPSKGELDGSGLDRCLRGPVRLHWRTCVGLW